MNKVKMCFVGACAAMLTTTALTAIPATAFSQGVSVDATQLLGDIAGVQKEIEAAEKDVATYQGGIPQVMASGRLETLRLTKAILENRLAAEQGGATIKLTVLAGAPDPELAAKILSEIEAQIKVVADSETELSTMGDGSLAAALTMSRIEAEKLSLADLRASWYRAAYGVIYPGAMPQDSSSAAPAKVGSTDDVSAASVNLEWADPDFPKIDYNRSIFSQLHKEGFEIHGWWGLQISKAEIDDSPSVFGLNLSQFKDGFQINTPKLQAGCKEGTASLIYDTDDYLLTDFQSNTIPVTYRIDEQGAVNARWNKITSSTGAGLFDKQGEEFLRDIYSAKKLFVRVVENNGKKHDATFELTGIKPVIEAIAKSCSFSLIELSKEDYLALQALLNAAGFDAGKPDGAWGRGSKNAMRAFQASVGLKETGAPDKETLKKLGFEK